MALNDPVSIPFVCPNATPAADHVHNSEQNEPVVCRRGNVCRGACAVRRKADDGPATIPFVPAVPTIPVVPTVPADQLRRPLSNLGS